MSSIQMSQEEYLQFHVSSLLNQPRGRDPRRVFVIEHGRAFVPGALPATIRRMEIGQCYANAQELALAHPELTYVEGVAAGLTVRDHAWCVTGDGLVIDPTWREPESCAYFGIPFQTSYLKQVIDASRMSVRVLSEENEAIFRLDPLLFLANVGGTPPWVWTWK